MATIKIKIDKKDLPKQRIITPKHGRTHVIPNKKKEGNKNACRCKV